MAKTELEEAGESTEGMAESTATLRAEIKALSGVDIMLNPTTFKSTYQIMEELAGKWEGLSDIAQATITELVAGKHQGNLMSSLMSSFDIAQDALETSLDSSGSAMKEHAKWSESLEARLLKLKATWQSLSQSFMSSDFLKGAVDVIIALVDAVDQLIQAIGVVPTLLGGFIGFKSVIGIFKSFRTTQIVGGVKGIADVLIILNNAFPKTTALITRFISALKGMSAGSIIGGIKSLGASLIKFVASNPYIAAAVIAVTALTTAFTYQKKQAEELAKEVEELTSKYKEEHESLKKIEGDYDTSNESSMVSRYAKLSKGVDGLGRNISLTVDEYSEYQGIVNKIAEQFPSLISGYDEQGNAILSCKGNVEQLTEAYEKLIHAQNQEILSSNAGDIERDWENTISQANGYDFWEDLGNLFSLDGLFGGKLDVWDMKTDTAEWLGSLTSDTSQKEIEAAFTDNYRKFHETIQALQNAGYDVDYTSGISGVSKVLKDALKKEPQKIRGILDNYYSEFDGAVAEYKTKATALLSEAFDVSSSISGLNYGNISEELQSIAYQTVNSLDFDFLNDLTKNGVTIDQWVKNMLDSLNSLSVTDNKQIKTGFELQTKFNGGDISYGQYINQLKDTIDFIDKDLKVPEEVKNQIKLSLNSEDVLTDYKALVHDLENIGFDDATINKFLNSLSAEEYSAAMTIIPNLDAETTIDKIQAMIDEKLATEFEFNIEVQTEGIEAWNNALAESRSAAGLTSESIKVLQARYKDLDGYNAAALFEKTANGIHLNNKELSRLEEQYINTNKLDIQSNLNKLIIKYNELTEEIKGCTDAQEKESLQIQADTYKEKIDELSILSSQYDGLTSAFSKWQNALEGAEEGDNYDSLYENLESIKELRDKGLVGTDKFKTAVQLMSNEDLSTASTDEIVSAYEKGYPKMQRYFTEGQKGCKNFLNDVSKLNSEWAHMNKDGSWEINFNAEEVAKELGVSVDFILQIAKKLKDYGFEVNLEDSSVDNLKTKIERTEAKLKELGQSPVDINVDIEANAENLGTIEAEIENAKAKIQEINNSSVEPNIKTAQLEDAQAKLETLIDKKIEASQPAFMSLNTSQVSASLVDALEKVQSYQNAINEVNKLLELKEAGIKIDDSQLKSAQEKVDECAKAIQGLDGDVKVAIGLEEDGSIDSIKKAFEEGKVKIDANTDPALTKIEQLAENVERIEDKDVTINVTVNGLDEVKELNKQINLATDIDGDIDKLSEYVESAKTLSSLDDNIASFVTAEIDGNVIETPEFKLNNLETFAEGANKLKDTGSFVSNITVNIDGNVVNKGEEEIKRLGEFAEHAETLKNVNSKQVDITANISGNVISTEEYKINNLKTFTDSAKDIEDIDSKEVTITANVKGNVTGDSETDGRFEHQINNLKTFTDSAKDIEDIESKEVTITANVKGNITGDSENAGKFEYQINNLETFAEGAKALSGVGDVSSTVTAKINTGEDAVIEEWEHKLDNLKVFAEGAKALKDVENVDVSVTANVKGNVTGDSETDGRFEHQINNLETFADGAKALQNVENVNVKVTADVEGDVIWHPELVLNNLNTFADAAKSLKDVEDVDVNVKATVEGDAIWHPEAMLNNLNTFADGAKSLKDVGSVEVTVTADADGDAIWHPEAMLNNLNTFAEGAKALKDVGDVSASVTAKLNTKLSEADVTDIGMFEGRIDNLKTFAEGARALKGVGDVSSTVTAKLDTKLGEADATDSSMTGRINNLKVFAEGAKALSGVGDVSSTVTAKAEGNVITGENASGNLSSLTEFKSLVSGLSNQTVNISVTANVDSANISQAITLLSNVANSGVFKDYSATVQVGAKIATIDDTVVKNYKAPDKKGKVSYSVDENSPVFTWKAPDKDGVVNYDAKVEALTDSQKHKTGTITYKVNVEGLPIVNGTANVGGTAFANGTSGKAYRQGDWGAKRTETALTGELGPELVVYRNKYWTVGDNGAEFAKIPKGAIVFNHRQTEELFANGKVTSGGGRGRALVNGTAFADGTAYVTGSGSFYEELTTKGARKEKTETVKTVKKVADTATKAIESVADTKANGKFYGSGNNSSSKKSGGSGGGSGGSSSSSSKEENKFEETIDWIETKISRVQRAIDKLDKKASNIYKKWSTRNSALADEIGKVQEEIDIQQKAYERYIKEADSVGLSSSYAEKVRNGEINIETITDEDLADKIKKYQDFYEKAIDAKDAIEELKETESSLYAQRVENVSSQYEGILGVIEHEKNILDEYIAQSEANAMLVSGEYYKALSKNEKENLSELEAQRDSMIAEFNAAMDSGTIEKGSEAYYDLVSSIDEVTLAIAQSNTQLKEYEQTLQQLSWESFDLLHERISGITEETEFLIELMSNKKLYDDSGQLTNEGSSTMGLHGVAYNVNMAQADKYAKEAARLKNELAKDPYDTELEERYREMIALQQEYILSAEDEKNAIADLVEEGIQLEIDALEELISKKNEELSAEKDLYEYSKKVKEQTSEIANLEKMRSSYLGDTSEEGRMKLQQIEVELKNAKEELAETEQDKVIEGTEKLLDNLMLEYQETINTRLDNIDVLISEVVSQINADASIIGDTLREVTDSVGYALSDSMKTIWDNSTTSTTNVITTYGEKFTNAQTTTNAALNNINTNLQNMIAQLNKEAKTNVKSASTSSAAKPKTTTSTNKTNTKKPVKKATGGDGKPKEGDRVKYISGQYYYDSEGKRPLGSHKKGEYVYITNINKKKWATHPYHISTGNKLGKGDLGWLKLNQISGYATGKKDFLNDEIAWTQENDSEIIVRPSDGAILTKIKSGDSVLNSAASGNIWNMANNPADFIKNNLSLDSSNVPNNSNVQSNIQQNFENITFAMPNVKNYDEMLAAMKKDKNFEKLLMAITIDQIAGKSSLAKGKALR